MEIEAIRQFLKKYGVGVGLGVVGLGLMGMGIWQYIRPSQMEVEVVKSDQVSGFSDQNLKKKKIVVDVSGAVEKPGVYELPEGARVAEALTKAGGLAEKADRIWVQRYVNLAQKVKDGMKIYIPWKSDQVSGFSDQDGGGGGRVMGANTGVVSVNTASLSELDSLWGIGESRAKAIIGHRPYSSLSELVTKAGIPQSVLDKNEGRMGL